MASNRVHYLRRKSYNTRSNKIRKLRAPGGRLTIQYRGKRVRGPQPAMATKEQLSGLTATPSRINSQNRISRPYGGVYTPSQVKNRILRAFLVEEVKVVKKFVKDTKKAAPEKKSAPKKNTNKK